MTCWRTPVCSMPHAEQRYADNGELKWPNEIDLPLITLGGTSTARSSSARRRHRPVRQPRQERERRRQPLGARPEHAVLPGDAATTPTVTTGRLGVPPPVGLSAAADAAANRQDSGRTDSVPHPDPDADRDLLTRANATPTGRRSAYKPMRPGPYPGGYDAGPGLLPHRRRASTRPAGTATRTPRRRGETDRPTSSSSARPGAASARSATRCRFPPTSSAVWSTRPVRDAVQPGRRPRLRLPHLGLDPRQRLDKTDLGFPYQLAGRRAVARRPRAGSRARSRCSCTMSTRRHRRRSSECRRGARGTVEVRQEATMSDTWRRPRPPGEPGRRSRRQARRIAAAPATTVAPAAGGTGGDTGGGGGSGGAVAAPVPAATGVTVAVVPGAAVSAAEAATAAVVAAVLRPGPSADATDTGTRTDADVRTRRRPGRQSGLSRRRHDDRLAATPVVLVAIAARRPVGCPAGSSTRATSATPPWNQWPGDRGDLYLPFLFMRANAGDLGARPVVGAFWESPDILLLADVDPAVAPAVPPDLGQTALAGRPNTLYAHVWNFGSRRRRRRRRVLLVRPDAGHRPGRARTLIGTTSLSLGARGSGRSHAVAKCPTPGYRPSSTAATSASLCASGTRPATGWAPRPGTRR